MVLHDGAMGTLLRGHVRSDETVDDLCVRAPELVRGVHRDYLRAGARLIQTNSMLIGLRSSERRRRRLRDAALACAREAREDAKQDAQLVATIGPLGTEPRAYWTEIEAWLELGVRRVRIETLTSARDAHAALDAWRDVARGLNDAILMLGCSVAPIAGAAPHAPDDAHLGDWVVALAHRAADSNVAVGLNCCAGPAGLRALLEALCSAHEAREAPSECAPWVDPSAGLECYLPPDAWAHSMAELIDGLPLSGVGGCCGTTPAHVAFLHELVGSC